jgi:hypothetical protein
VDQREGVTHFFVADERQITLRSSALRFLLALDTSAIIAAITNEQDSSQFRAAMLGADSLSISSVAVLETKIVVFRPSGTGCGGSFRGPNRH